jgi:hypothetical protein
MLIVTYAGFAGESDLLESIYQRGMGGRRIDHDLECYEADELFLFWSHTPRQPWQDEAYYAQHRKILRPAQFERLHKNEWVSSESRFIDPAIWDQNVSPGLRPDPTGALFIGIDASVKHDSTALVCVKYDAKSDNLVLADHRIWTPSPNAPMDLEATVEFYLRRFDGWQTRIEKILVDPFWMHRTITTLQQAGRRLSHSRRRNLISRLRPRRFTPRSQTAGSDSMTCPICALMCSMRRVWRQAAVFGLLRKSRVSRLTALRR